MFNEEDYQRLLDAHQALTELRPRLEKAAILIAEEIANEVHFLSPALLRYDEKVVVVSYDDGIEDDNVRFPARYLWTAGWRAEHANNQKRAVIDARRKEFERLLLGQGFNPDKLQEMMNAYDRLHPMP